jgi:recombination DNA repair RAD52 pathway protein
MPRNGDQQLFARSFERRRALAENVSHSLADAGTHAIANAEADAHAVAQTHVDSAADAQTDAHAEADSAADEYSRADTGADTRTYARTYAVADTIPDTISNADRCSDDNAAGLAVSAACNAARLALAVTGTLSDGTALTAADGQRYLESR